MTNKITLALIGTLALVVAAGGVYIYRPADEPDLEAVVQPTPQVEAAVDNTVAWPPNNDANGKPLPFTRINEVVRVSLKTNKGEIKLLLDGQRAPLTVGNFVYLAENNFYDGTTFHRVIPDFMIQGGDPLSKDQDRREEHGTGGPNYKFADEISQQSLRLQRGVIAMANAGPNTNGSQFFIVTAPATPHLDGRHTPFGMVAEGMEVVDEIVQLERDERDNPLEPVVIEDVAVTRGSLIEGLQEAE